MWKEKDGLTKDINELIKAIEKSDPLSCDIDAFSNKEKALQDWTTGLGNNVEDGHEKLKWL